MKKLNRKGFTLVELLAVIVILAIVVGIALVTVLPTLDRSKEKSFEVAVDTIRVYIQDQVDLAQLGSGMAGTTYNQAVAESGSTCYDSTHLCDNTTADVLGATGYTNNISAIKWYVSNGKVTISCATVKTTGDYKQGSKISACS